MSAPMPRLLPIPAKCKIVKSSSCSRVAAKNCLSARATLKLLLLPVKKDFNAYRLRVVTLHSIILVCLGGVGCIGSTLSVSVLTHFHSNFPRTAISVTSNCSLLSSFIVSFILGPYGEPFASLAATFNRRDIIGYY
jgi:hypothetical protein